ncbi:dihydrofolate reductase [Chamaesiphon sp. VAR_48_metabat_403]|uniref:dihydrofolate reductase n=1 Tax=Chamaesiphon sp. VAR_48_metabat_403 TaxID=2964700 RepID=UPI00286E8627|nr:dihydrofolate reductase [Chamaesiphon sp. VAR_48_metabat_403]
MQRILIAAIDKDGGIGKDGYMPWHYPADLKLFMNLTMGNTIVMGRKTFDGMFDREKAPLKGRQNIVVTSQAEQYRSRFTDKYLASELTFTNDINCKNIELATDAKVFYCGGANLYQQVINLVNLDIIYLSRLDESYDCDTFFPRNPESIDKQFEPYLPPHFINSFSDTMAGKKSFTFQIYTPKPLIIY